MLAVAISRHHERLETQAGNELVATVQLANLMAARIGPRSRPDQEMPLAEHPVARLFELDEATLAERLSLAEHEYHSVADIL